ncbi:MAG: hypothetical protein ACFE95_03605 [Candidatus Hodarchaeota archaeon]
MNREKKKRLQESIDKAMNKMVKEWEILDKPREPSQELLSFYQAVDELVRHEAKIKEDKIEVKKAIERKTRTRNDIGEIIIGKNVIKKIEIIDEYEGYARPLKSVAYYQILPVLEAKKPLVHILQWIVSHYHQWIIWFTSPIAKGLKARTAGEYIIVHSLDEKESEDYDLLLKYSRYPCFGRSDGIDILLGYEDLDEAIDFVERFLPSIIERNLYSDSEFLKFLQKYKQIMLGNLLEE